MVAGKPKKGIKITGWEKVKKYVDKLGVRVQDLRPLFDQYSADFYKNQKSGFTSRGIQKRSGGKGKLDAIGVKKMPDLTPRYKKQKKKDYGFVYPILVASGRLVASLLFRDSREAINIINERDMTIGTSVPYAIYHHSMQKPRKIMPRRPLWDERENGPMMNRWARLAEAYYKKAMEGKFDGPR